MLVTKKMRREIGDFISIKPNAEKTNELIQNKDHLQFNRNNILKS